MQDKRRKRPLMWLILLLVLGLGVLASLEVPAPRQPIEQELDGRSFLTSTAS